MDLSNPPTGVCSNCKKRPAKWWWSGEDGTGMAAVHGMVSAWCEYCCVEAQLAYAEKLAANVPDLRAKLQKLVEEDHA